MPTLPAWLISKPVLITAAVIVALGYVTYLGHEIYSAGGVAEEAKQAKAQVVQDAKVNKAYDKVDKQTPYSGNTATIYEWLSQYTRSGY